MPMKRIALTSLILILVLSSSGINDKISPVETSLKILWKKQVGNVSHRTKPVLKDGKIIIGSNGQHFMDFRTIDNGNGVYVLSLNNGKQIRHFAGEKFGDMDVNGIVSIDDKILFGNDNDEVLCYDIDGKQKWQILFSGDVEHAPAIVSIDGKKIPVFATETGEVRAINPNDGTTLWSYYHPTFSGWKTGDNRFVFKVKMHFSSPQVFFNEPALIDLNQDGTDDLIYNCDQESLIAINGLNGKKMWSYKPANGRMYMGREKPIVLKQEKRIVFNVYKSSEQTNSIEYLSFNGKHLHSFDLNHSGSPLLSHFDHTLFTTKGIVLLDKDRVSFKTDEALFVYDNTKKKKQVRYSDGQVSQSSFMFSGEECVAVVFQNDLKHYNQGTLAIMGTKSGQIHFETALIQNSEFTPVIADVNKDGTLDILVACYDGNLYAYELKIPSNKLIL